MARVGYPGMAPPVTPDIALVLLYALMARHPANEPVVFCDEEIGHATRRLAAGHQLMLLPADTDPSDAELVPVGPERAGSEYC